MGQSEARLRNLRERYTSQRPHAQVPQFLFLTTNQVDDHEGFKTLTVLRLVLNFCSIIFSTFSRKAKISHDLFAYTQRKGNLRESIKYLFIQIYFHINCV